MQKKGFSMAMAALLAGTMALSAGCGPRDPGVKDNGEYLEGSIEVKIALAGYGTEWLKSIANAYESAYPGCLVDVKEVQDRNSLSAQIVSSANTADIVVVVDSIFSRQADGYLVDISDVLKETPDGFETSSYDRMNPSLREFYETDDGKFYQLPWVSGYKGYVYNKTTLDELYGEGNYTLPRTTDEFLEMCQDILDTSKAKGSVVYPTIFTVADTYASFLLDTLWWQYSGETRDQFYWGYLPVKNADGTTTYRKCETVEDFRNLMYGDPGREKSLEFFEKVLLSAEFGGYAHPECDKMNFQEAQTSFFGNGYGTNMSKSAFMICGDWLNKEMGDTADDSDVRFMRMPILSAITETLESNITEGQLRAVVDAIDRGDAYDASLGVTEADYARLTECRFSGMVSVGSHVMAIPKLKRNGETKYELAKQFLKYVLSEEGQALFVIDQNGLNMPYGFDTTGFLTNEFTDSVRDVTNDWNYHMVVNYSYKSPLGYAGGLACPGYIESMFFRADEDATEMLERFNERNILQADNFLRLIV